MRLFPVITVLALSACTVGPNFSAPKTAAPAAYLPAGETAPTTSAPTGPSADWWSLFQSEPLNQMVDAAVGGNLSLQAENFRLAAAREAVTAATGQLYPQASASGSIGRSEINLANFGFPGPNPVVDFYSLGPSVSYALDVFGGTHRQIETLAARAEAQQLQLATARLILSGQIVTDATGIAAARGELAALNDIVANDEKNLDLVRTAQNAGRSTEVDVLSAKSQLAQDRTLLPPIRAQWSVARHALAVLTGQQPGVWMPPDFDLSDFRLPAQFPLVVPSALVHQRPDILAAEADLHAASAQIGVATAALYPSITISAFFSQGTTDPSLFFSGAKSGWNFGAGLTAPLFEGGTLRANRRAAVDQYNAAFAAYRQTVLQAFGQVADGLTALGDDNDELAEQADALDAATHSLALVRESYQAGESGILQVLDAQRQYQQARLGLVRAQAARLDDTIALLVATGSAWRPGS